MSDRELMLHRSDLMDAKLSRLRNEFNGMQSLIDVRMGALAETVAAKVLAALCTSPSAATSAAANGQLSSVAVPPPESGETSEVDFPSPLDITSIAADFEPEHAVQDRAWRKSLPIERVKEGSQRKVNRPKHLTSRPERSSAAHEPSG